MEDFDDFLEIIDFGFPRFQFTRSDRFHELDKFRFYSRFNLTKVSVDRKVPRILIVKTREAATQIFFKVCPTNKKNGC
jgi:hypothetical protein